MGGADGLTNVPRDNVRGVVPDDVGSATDIFQGGTITGNVCWSVNADDVESLVMYAETGFGDTRVFFALKP